MIKKLILPLLFFIICFNLCGQTPGYMGKRFAVGYTNSVNPNLLSLAVGVPSTPDLSHCLKLNYIISKQRELCFSANFSNRKIPFDIIGANYQTEYYFEKYSSIEYALGLRRFNKSKFAPLGAYSKWDATFIDGWVNYKEYTYYEYDYLNDVSVATIKPGGKVKFKGLGVSYSRGRQRVFSDKYVVDYGVKGTLMLISESETKDSHESEIGSQVSGMLNINPIVNFYIGIGFLAF